MATRMYDLFFVWIHTSFSDSVLTLPLTFCRNRSSVDFMLILLPLFFFIFCFVLVFWFVFVSLSVCLLCHFWVLPSICWVANDASDWPSEMQVFYLHFLLMKCCNYRVSLLFLVLLLQIMYAPKDKCFLFVFMIYDFFIILFSYCCCFIGHS